MSGGSPAWPHTPQSTGCSLVKPPGLVKLNADPSHSRALVLIHWRLYCLPGASIGDGQSAVASNIANTTYRLQWWDFTKFDLPEISNGTLSCINFIPFHTNSGQMENNNMNRPKVKKKKKHDMI